MTTIDIDLDVATPEECIKVLRIAAEKYHESASELVSAWQDKNAGRFWYHAAIGLESLADRLEKRNNRINGHYFRGETK